MTKAGKLGKSTGRWTREEHKKFIEGLKKYGKNWKKVEGFIGTRTGTQIRSHAQKFFNRIKREVDNKESPAEMAEQMKNAEGMLSYEQVDPTILKSVLHDPNIMKQDRNGEEIKPTF